MIKTDIQVGDIISIIEVMSGVTFSYQIQTSNGYIYTIYPGEKVDLKVGDLHLSLSFYLT